MPRQLSVYSSANAQNKLWNPASLLPVMWLDDQAGNTLFFENGKISRWEDKMGSGRAVSQSSPNARPIYANGVYFDGTTAFLSGELGLPANPLNYRVISYRKASKSNRID